MKEFIRLFFGGTKHLSAINRLLFLSRTNTRNLFFCFLAFILSSFIILFSLPTKLLICILVTTSFVSHSLNILDLFLLEGDKNVN